MSHENSYNDAIDAASKLHSDTSVPIETTLESLYGLQEHVNCLIEASEIDLRQMESE